MAGEELGARNAVKIRESVRQCSPLRGQPYTPRHDHGQTIRIPDRGGESGGVS